MAVPAWATNLTTFWLQGSTTVTAIGTGGAGLGNPETDFFIQDTECISKAAWTNAIKGFIVDALGTTFTVPTDGAVIYWAKYDAAGSLDSKANGGLQMIIGSGSGDYYHYYIGGEDTLAFASWRPYTVDPNTATADNTTGTPSGSERWVGILGNLPTTSGPTKGNPIAIDAIRYGRCDVEYTAGSVGDGYNTFAGAEAYANDSTRRWGLIELLDGAFQVQGFHSFGTSGTAVDFNDSNEVIFIRNSTDANETNDAVSSAFNRFEVLNASSSVVWDNIIFQALGTVARGVFVHTAGTWTVTNCQFVDVDTTTLLAASSFTNTTWRRTNAVTAPGSTLTGSKILESTVGADAGALVWSVTTDTDGKLDGMEFTKGSAAHHAISLTNSTASNYTLRNCTFTDFNATDGQNDSVIYVAATTGSMTISAVNCTGTVSVKSAGATVTVSVDPITVKVTTKTSAGAIVGSCSVHLRASDGTGPFPFEESVTITRASTTATVSHTAHGMASNDKILLRGITDKTEDIGVHQITYINANSYSYTTTDSGSTNYTGTITCTFVALDGTTDAGTGVLSGTRVYATDQPVTGWARKSTSSPYYKEGPLTGSVDSADGYDVTAIMVSDE